LTLGFILVIIEIWCSQGFWDAQAHSCTHSQIDRPEYSMPPALFFNTGEGIKIVNT